jgi:hypothetical protein
MGSAGGSLVAVAALSDVFAVGFDPLGRGDES